MSRTPRKTPKKSADSSTRSPRSTFKGDELGKNKTQKTLLQYFNSKPVKEENSVKNASPNVSQLMSSSPIVISDDEELTMENFHVKTKLVSSRKFSLSTKSLKSKTESNLSSDESSVVCQESQRASLSTAVLKTIAPDNKKSLSVTSRKRKNSSNVNVSAEKKTRENGVSNDTTTTVSVCLKTTKVEPVPPNLVLLRSFSDKPMEAEVTLNSPVKCKIEPSSLSKNVNALNRVIPQDILKQRVNDSGEVCLNVKQEQSSAARRLFSLDNTAVDPKIVGCEIEPTSPPKTVNVPNCVTPKDIRTQRVNDTPEEMSLNVKQEQSSAARQLVSSNDAAFDAKIVENIDWSEPMEAEVFLTSPVKCKIEPTSPVKNVNVPSRITLEHTRTKGGENTPKEMSSANEVSIILKTNIKKQRISQEPTARQLFPTNDTVIDPKIIESVNWSEPIEAEVLMSSPVKFNVKPASSARDDNLRSPMGDKSSLVSRGNKGTLKLGASLAQVSTPSKLTAPTPTKPGTPAKPIYSTPTKPGTSAKTIDSTPTKPGTPAKPIYSTPTKPGTSAKTIDSTLTKPSTSAKPIYSTPTKPGTPAKPIASTPTKQNASTSPKSKSGTPKKGSPRKINADADNGNLLFVHCIKECHRYATMAFVLNPYNEKVAKDYLSLELPEKVVLFKLLARKWSWIRESDMKYEKIAHDQLKSLKALVDKDFLEDMTIEEDLNVILGVLKRPELAELCKTFKVDNCGTKNDSSERLLKFATCQGGLNFGAGNLQAKMKSEAFKKVGKCVRVAGKPREALRQIFEASMSPLYLDGKYYSFQERLHGMSTLMSQVKFEGLKLIPMALSDVQLFKTTAQFEEYVTSAGLKFELLLAKEKRNNDRGVELVREARASLLIYVTSEAVREFLNKTPHYLWRYTAGSNYASAIDAGIELFKKTKNYHDAVVALDALLGQERFRKHCRGNWYAEKALIMEKHLNRSTSEVYDVVVKGLREDLTPIGRLELSKKAQGLLKKKKNGLSSEQKDEIMRLVHQPTLSHRVKEIRCTEAPNMGTGTRQTYVELSSTGEREYFNVEQTARNSYFSDYPEGLHDEGKFVKHIILAAFWRVIYAEKEGAFVSKYQYAPLDWGTRAFYTNRLNEIKVHEENLRSNGIDGIVEEIKNIAFTYTHHHSLIDWKFVSIEMLPTIKNILTSLTLDKFFLLSNYLLESFRERRSGWPDLTLWNTVAGKFKFVEVKSTNDELSFKQIVWLGKLSEMGIDVEECRVNVAHKGNRRRTVDNQRYNDASQEVM